MKTVLTIVAIIISQVAAVAQIIWQKCLGGSLSEIPYSIFQTADSGYIVAGYSLSNDGDVSGNHGDMDYWITKLSASGTLQWQKSYGGSSAGKAVSVIQTKDSEYVAAGFSDSNDGDVTGNHGSGDAWIIKLAQNGNIQWRKCLGGTSVDGAVSIRQTFDGGFIVAGGTDSNDGDVYGNHGNSDCWIIKLSDTGSLEWQKCFGGSSDDDGSLIIQTSDSGYVFAASSSSNDGDVSGNHGLDDYWIVKISAIGSIQWEKSFGGSGYDQPYSIARCFDGGYIVVGYTQSNDGDVSANHGLQDCWVIKLSPSGVLQWQKSLGSSGADYGFSIQQTSDTGYIVAGYTGSNDGDVTGIHGFGDYWIVKLSSSGALEWEKCLGGSDPDEAYAIVQAYDGNYVVAGSSASNDGDVTGHHGSDDFWVVKFGPVTGTLEILPAPQISVSPNPVCGDIHINGVESANIRLYDLLGQLIKEAAHANAISLSGYPAGAYLIEVYDNERQLIYRDKIIKY